MSKYVGIDLGGTAIKYALMNENATIVEQSSTRTPLPSDSSLEDLLIILEGIIEEYINKRNPLEHSQLSTTLKSVDRKDVAIKGVAISMPGIIDNKTGHAYIGGAITYLTGVNLAKLLMEKFQIPVTIENDAKSAALAELWKGNLKDCKNGAVITLGTGVGGGIIINGALYSGGTFAAGEFSYILVDTNKPYESGSFWGSIGGVKTLYELVHQNTGIPLSKLDGFKVFEMATHGDEGALEALDQYTKRLALPIYNLQTILDLELMAIGGGISKQPLLLTYLQKNLDENYERNPIHNFAPFVPRPKVTTCKFYNDANIIGALYHHLQLYP